MIEDTIVSEGGFLHHPGVRAYNRYRPPQPTPGNAEEAGPWLDLIAKLYPEDHGHIEDWLAHRVQRPGEKVNHALVMGGPPGIGKDSVLEPPIQAVGPWNVGDVSPANIVERFNPFLRNVILRVSEARDVGEGNRYALYEHMKTIIAAPPDTLRIDEKYLGEYRIPNLVGVIFTTNNRTNGLYLPPDDRRHYVAWSEASPEDFPEGYFDRLYTWYRNGGIGHVRAYLASRDLSSFDPKAPPPKTDAFWAMVNTGRAPEEGELGDVLDALGTTLSNGEVERPKAVTLPQLIKKANDKDLWEIWSALGDRKNRRRVPHLMQAVRYIPVHNPYAKDGLWKIEGKRQTVYATETLPLRDRIVAAEALVNGE